MHDATVRGDSAAITDEVLQDAVARKLGIMMDALGGARALYGEPVRLNGEEIIPVARISIELGVDPGRPVVSVGRGAREAPLRVVIESVGFLQSGPDGPVFCATE